MAIPKIQFDQHLWRESARGGWTRLRGAWGNRQERKIVIGLAALSLASCGTGGMVAAWTRACAGTCPTAETIENFAPRQASLVLDARGGVLGQFYRERRTLIHIDSLPNHVPMAFVAIEDKRFFEHEGVDPVRIVAAVRDNIIKGWGGPGGSTISMQLARNLFPQQLPASETSVRRKVAEIKLAMQMERRFSKRRILELYLNHIYLGSGAYGVEAAARSYFGKPARELNIVEAATIAGLPQAPSAYDPRRHPERAERRRNVVLQAMADARVITQAQADEAKRTPLALSPPGGARGAPYFVEAVRRELEDRFGELLYTGGLRIHTAIDPVLQRTAEQGLEEQLRQIERGTYGGFRGPTYPQFTAGIKPGQAVTHTPYLQGIVVVLDPATGLVRALVGGRDFRQSQFNRAVQALRQPGSSFKPFVYAAALEHGRSPASGISDGPLTINIGSESWSPKNYDGTYGGYTSLRSALRNSRNLATIRLGRETGIENVRALAARTGLETRIPGYPSVYIGSAGVYPIDMMAAYASFANGGWRVEPQLVARVENHRGELLWAPAPAPRRAVEPGVAWILTDMLREVVDRGTGYLARDPSVGGLPYEVPAAGKTGTTNDNTDVWFVGYTPDLLTGVWMGFDTPRPIIAGGTGGTLAVPVWARVMRTAYANRKAPEPWAKPSDVVMRRVSGGRVLSAECDGGTPDYFAAKHAPAGSCPQRSSTPEFVDPTPELPGRPVFPGQKREPRPEDFITPGAERERR
ncbi:penicillin-binding protein 1A [Longimicrobium sp.]|uniref:penicillin-binding protein 1A n=1 Tax=Longimicrobium sp. TaxID=2029185 RepID=UPI003B39FCF0